MLEEKVIDRYNAQDLFQNIKQAAGGIFCRKCCYSGGSTEYEPSSDSDTSDYERYDDTIRPLLISNPKETHSPRERKYISFEKKWPRQSVVADPVESTRSPE